MYIVYFSGMELHMAKSEFAKKEEELTRAFAKVESLLGELSSLQKRKVPSIGGDRQQETDLGKLQQELEVSAWNDAILKHDYDGCFFPANSFFCKHNAILFLCILFRVKLSHR